MLFSGDKEDKIEAEEVETNEGSENEDEGEGEKLKRRGAEKRVRLPIYQKLLAVREVDRLVEEGVRYGLEKKVMARYPEMFMGTKGKMKSGMLGRWIVLADEQEWRKIPFERMSAEDRKLKDLPDWIRLPLGLPPRSLDKFKSGTTVPSAVTKRIIELIQRTTCGMGSRLTSGTLKTESVKAEADDLLKSYNESQKKTAEEHGIALPKQKESVTTRWVNRLLEHYGWKRNSPNTLGAYLEFDDERMQKSRKAWSFLRLGFHTQMFLGCGVWVLDS